MTSDQSAIPPRSILVPTDGSDAAEAALDRALTIAEPTDAIVHVLTVVDTDGAPLRFDVETVHELEESKNRLVDEITAALDGHGVDVTGAVRRGRPAREIVRYAEEHDIDLLVIGRTGQQRVAAALLGSTTDRVVRTASIPVIVVPETDERTDG
ncbi:universal stress protein [Natrialbaceae archaeon A-arb3/5]